MSQGTSKETLRDFRINLERRKREIKESTSPASTKSSVKYKSPGTHHHKHKETTPQTTKTHKRTKIPEVIMSHTKNPKPKQISIYDPTMDLSSGDLESDDEIPYFSSGFSHSKLFSGPSTPSKPINASMSPIHSTRKNYYESTEITIDAPSELAIDTTQSPRTANLSVHPSFSIETSTSTSHSLSLTPSLSVERAEKRKKHKKPDTHFLSLAPSFTLESPESTHDSLIVGSSFSIERPKKHRKHKKHELSESHAVHFAMETHIHDSEAASSESFFSRNYTALFADEEEEDELDVTKLIAEKKRASNAFKLGDDIGVDTRLRDETPPSAARRASREQQRDQDLLNISDTISVDSELLMEPLTNETVFRMKQPRRVDHHDEEFDTSELEDILDIPPRMMLGSLTRFRPKTFD